MAHNGVVRDSLTVSSWTVVSRLTGLCRLAAVAGVLGPTYLGNTFSAMNEMPNLIYFGLLGGGLFPSVLIPALVRHLERADRRSVERVARGFLGLVLAVLGTVVAAAILFRPVIMHLFTLGADPAVAADQRRAGGLLLAVLAPQILLYGLAGTAGAVLQANGRFALAAAAPALENVGIIITLGVTAVLFGTGTPLGDVQSRQLLLLGAGTTASVALHAGAVWAGARRAGVMLRPCRGWRDPEVRQIMARMRPTLGTAGLAALSVFAAMLLANRVPGGVVAFQLAETLCMLPVVVGAVPIAVALVPRLARHSEHGDQARYAEEFIEGITLAYFLAIPASLGLLTFAGPIARAVSFGEMATSGGVPLIAATLTGLALGILGEVGFQVGTGAAYARMDTRTPLRAMLVRSLLTAAGMLVSLVFTGRLALVALGASLSVGTLAGTGYLLVRLAPFLPPNRGRVGPALRRAVGASFLMLIPAGLVVALTDRVGGLADRSTAVGVVAVATATFVALQTRWRSPELGSVMAALPMLPEGLRRRYAGTEHDQVDGGQHHITGGG